VSQGGFTSAERAMPMHTALDDPGLRIRLLTYVAAKRGISTGDALEFTEALVRRELTYMATLGQFLDHLDNPHLDRPDQMNLDSPLTDIFDDHRQLDRLVRSVSLETGDSYIDALQGLYQAALDGARTLGQALGSVSIAVAKPDGVLEGVKLLESADDQLAETYARDTQQLRAEPVNARGVVQLAEDADVGAMLADPVERENRLARARRAAAGAFDGDEGRNRFFDDDRMHLEAGLDLVRTFERASEIRTAEASHAQQRRELDQAVNDARGARHQARTLDSRIASLRGQRDELAPRTADPVDHHAKRLRLLDTSGNSEVLSVELQQRVIELGRQRPDLSYADRRRRVLEQAEPGTPLTLDDETVARRHAAAVRLETPDSDGPSTPAGVDPASHRLEKRVQERLRRNGFTGPAVPGDAYIKALEQVMAEDAGRTT
jgi:hypothetical protein